MDGAFKETFDDATNQDEDAAMDAEAVTRARYSRLARALPSTRPGTSTGNEHMDRMCVLGGDPLLWAWMGEVDGRSS